MGTRRRFTPEVNVRVVLELIGGVKGLAETCREYQLKPQRLARWKEEFLDKAPRVFWGKSERTPRGHESRSQSGWSVASDKSWKWPKKPPACSVVPSGEVRGGHALDRRVSGQTDLSGAGLTAQQH